MVLSKKLFKPIFYIKTIKGIRNKIFWLGTSPIMVGAASVEENSLGAARVPIHAY